MPTHSLLLLDAAATKLGHWAGEIRTDEMELGQYPIPVENRARTTTRTFQSARAATCLAWNIEWCVAQASRSTTTMAAARDASHCGQERCAGLMDGEQGRR